MAFVRAVRGQAPVPVTGQEGRDALAIAIEINDAIKVAGLKRGLPNVTVASTEAFGVAPDHVEAAAFAWLAKRTLNRESGNLSSVTGASENSVLGGIYYP